MGRRYPSGSRRSFALERAQPRFRRRARQLLDHSATARPDSRAGGAYRCGRRRQADDRPRRSGVRYPDAVGRDAATVRAGWARLGAVTLAATRNTQTDSWDGSTLASLKATKSPLIRLSRQL